MRNRAMILHDCERIAGENFLHDVYIGKHRACGRGESRYAAVTLREKTFTDECADDSVSYGVHERFEKLRVYTIARKSNDFEKRRAPGGNLSDDAAGNIAALQRGQRRVGGIRSDGGEQTAGSLWVEEQSAEFVGDAGRKSRATLHEVAVIFHTAGEKPAASCFDCAREILHARVIQLHGNPAADGHFARVAEKRKA